MHDAQKDIIQLSLPCSRRFGPIHQRHVCVWLACGKKKKKTTERREANKAGVRGRLVHHSDMYQLSSGMGAALAHSSFIDFIVDRIRLTFSTSTAIPKGQCGNPYRQPSYSRIQNSTSIDVSSHRSGRLVPLQEVLNKASSFFLLGWERSPSMPPSSLSLYGLSSWNFALLGAWAFYWLETKNSVRSMTFFDELFHNTRYSKKPLRCFRYIRYGAKPLYPGMSLEAGLLVVQSVCSYMCDVATFGRASAWKPIDRFAASAFVLWQCCKLAWLEMTWAEGLVWVATLTAGFGCFKNSMSCLKHPPKQLRSHGASGPAALGTEVDADLGVDLRPYMWWHTAWHFSLPLGAAVWMAVRASQIDDRIAG